MTRIRRLEYDRVRDELERYPGPGEPIFSCAEWNGKVVIGRWSWFWKRIQFWRYKVVKIPIDDVEDGRPGRSVKVLWRFK